jgi:protein-arginine kinase
MKLVAKHLISKELIKQPASAVLLNEDESLSIMINEEDHIRIQAMGNDLSLTAGCLINSLLMRCLATNFILLCWSMVSKRIKDKLTK